VHWPNGWYISRLFSGICAGHKATQIYFGFVEHISVADRKYRNVKNILKILQDLQKN
jgi:hypothetical protein